MRRLSRRLGCVSLKQVAKFARMHHGVVTRQICIDSGASARTVDRWVERGVMHRLYPNVYSFGHDLLPPYGKRLAVVWAAGPETALGLQSAGAHWGITAGDPQAWHLVRPVGSSRGRRLDGVFVHRSRILRATDVVTRHQVPVTTVARTLVDLALTLDRGPLRRAVHEAEVARLLDVNAVREVLDRAPSRKGASMLRALLEIPAPPTVEEFVMRFLEFCEAHELPVPIVSAHLDAGLPVLTEADVLFKEAKVIVELDGFRVHMTRQRFESDRRRDSALLARDYLTVRVTWHRLQHDAGALASELRAILARRCRVQPAPPVGANGTRWG